MAATRLDRRLQAAVGEDRRRDAAGEVAQLGDREARVLACGAHERSGLGLVGEPLLGAAEVHAQRDEPGLRAVVQVALDAPQLGGLDVERPLPRAGQHVDALDEVALLDPRQAVAVEKERAEGQRRPHAEHRPDRPQITEARQRPDDPQVDGDQRAELDLDAEAALAVVPHGPRAHRDGVQRERDRQPEPDPHRPEVAAAGGDPDDRHDEAGEQRQRDVQLERGPHRQG